MWLDFDFYLHNKQKYKLLQIQITTQGKNLNFANIAINHINIPKGNQNLKERRENLLNILGTS